MAYVSEVTTRRLEAKNPLPQDGWMEEDEDGDYSQGSPRGSAAGGSAAGGIMKIGEFAGGVRCMQVHRRAAPSGIGAISVWTGEQDGALSVRDRQGNGLFTLEKKKSVFVTSLLCHGSEHLPSKYMYAGMSDGNIRVYEQVGFQSGDAPGSLDYKLLRIVKKHSAAVTCMLAVRQYVVTGGGDWWMFVWEWSGGFPFEGGNFTVVRDRYAEGSAPRGYSKAYSGGKISLHRNTVRCLAHDQTNGVLYTGGDDAAIFAIPWHGDGLHVAGAREVGGASPRLMHRGAVRSLVVYESYLFSASEDGSMRVWSCVTEDAAGVVTGGLHVRTLVHGRSPLRCLLKDPAGGRIWVGGADGVLRVFNAHDHALVCEITRPHSGAVITGLHCVGRIDAMKWWVTGTDGICRLVYLESDAPDVDCGSSDQEVQLSYTIDRLREVTITNYGSLDRRKTRFARIQRVDADRKSKIKEVLGKARGYGIKRRYLHKLLQWHSKHKGGARRKVLGDLLQSTLDSGVQRIYFRKLDAFARMKRRARVCTAFAESLLVQSGDGLKLHYFGRLREHWRRVENRERRQRVAQVMMQTHSQGRLRSAFYPWFDTVRRSLLKRKKLMISEMLLAHSNGRLRVIYYYRLTKFLKRELIQGHKAKIHRMLAVFNTSSLRGVFFAKLLRFMRERRRERKRRQIGETLLGFTDTGLQRIYLRKARKFVADTSLAGPTDEHEALGDEISEMEKLLAECDEMSLEEIAAETAEVGDDIAVLEGELERLSGRVEDAERSNEALRAKVRAPVRADLDVHTEGETARDEAFGFLRKLGKYSIKCGHDRDVLANAHSRRRERFGASVFLGGLQELKDGLQRFLVRDDFTEEQAAEVLSQEMWQIPSGFEDRMDRKTVLSCNHGIQMMTIAVHQIENPVDKDLKKAQQDSIRAIDRYRERGGCGAAEQVTANRDTLLAIVLKVYDDRALKAAQAADELERTGRRSSHDLHAAAAAAAGSSSHSGRPSSGRGRPAPRPSSRPATARARPATSPSASRGGPRATRPASPATSRRPAPTGRR